MRARFPARISIASLPCRKSRRSAPARHAGDVAHPRQSGDKRPGKSHGGRAARHRGHRHRTVVQRVQPAGGRPAGDGCCTTRGLLIDRKTKGDDYGRVNGVAFGQEDLDRGGRSLGQAVSDRRELRIGCRPGRQRVGADESCRLRAVLSGGHGASGQLRTGRAQGGGPAPGFLCARAGTKLYTAPASEGDADVQLSARRRS